MDKKKLRELIKKLVKEYSGHHTMKNGSPRPFSDDIEELENYMYKSIYGGDGGHYTTDADPFNYNRQKMGIFELKKFIKKTLQEQAFGSATLTTQGAPRTRAVAPAGKDPYTGRVEYPYTVGAKTKNGILESRVDQSEIFDQSEVDEIIGEIREITGILKDEFNASVGYSEFRFKDGTGGFSFNWSHNRNQSGRFGLSLRSDGNHKLEAISRYNDKIFGSEDIKSSNTFVQNVETWKDLDNSMLISIWTQVQMMIGKNEEEAEEALSQEAKGQAAYYGAKADTGRIGYGLTQQPRMRNEQLNEQGTDPAQKAFEIGLKRLQKGVIQFQLKHIEKQKGAAMAQAATAGSQASKGFDEQIDALRDQIKAIENPPKQDQNENLFEGYVKSRKKTSLMTHMDIYKQTTLLEGTMKKLFSRFSNGETNEEILSHYAKKGVSMPETFLTKTRKQYENLKKQKLEIDFAEQEAKDIVTIPTKVPNLATFDLGDDDKKLAKGIYQEKIKK